MVEVTQDEIQAVARAVHGELSHIDVMKYLDMPDDTADRVAQAAIAALDAARGKAEPVAWQRRRLYSQAHEPAGVMPQWESCTCREATDMFEKRPGCEYRPLYSHPPADRVAQVVEWLRRENGLCDCHARCETECGCGA